MLSTHLYQAQRYMKLFNNRQNKLYAILKQACTKFYTEINFYMFFIFVGYK